MSFRELLFLHKDNTMAILLKTAPVRVSGIQIMQVRVQNKGKSVCKSRYDRDVSLRLEKLNLEQEHGLLKAINDDLWNKSSSYIAKSIFNTEDNGLITYADANDKDDSAPTYCFWRPAPL